MTRGLRARLLGFVCVIGLLTAGCSSDGGQLDNPGATSTADGPAVDSDADGGEASGGDDAPAAPTSSSATEGPLADAVFLTAVDEVVEGTVYEGLVDAVPGEFLLTATLVCERLAAGESRTDVLGLYLDALSAGEPTHDDARLAGALVGASIEVYCPDHFT